ncbi:MAG: hypothetical protein QOD76_340, partial [Solirubrobacteraceae bacterium]|nr:hypothetical protein [Solirubrobacteraceae bacterium]
MTAGEIAVAVATCGRPAALWRCLEAIAHGTTLPGELIVIDQAPSSGAREAVERWATGPVRYIEQPRRGVSASRNFALEVTSRPVLAVTDDDCTPDPGWVAAIAAALDRHPTPAAVTGPVQPRGPGLPGTYAVSLRPSPQPRDFRGRILPWTAGTGGNFAAPCDLLRERGGWDERLGPGSPGLAAEDTD